MSEPARANRRWFVLHLGCRYLLAVVFLMAAVTKITDLQGFEDRLLLRGNLPQTVALVIARVLPWLELTCGMCLVLGYAVREAAVLVALLLVLFLGYGLLIHNEADCNCFLFPHLKPLDVSWWYTVRNLFLLLCSVPVMVRPEEA